MISGKKMFIVLLVMCLNYSRAVQMEHSSQNEPGTNGMSLKGHRTKWSPLGLLAAGCGILGSCAAAGSIPNDERWGLLEGFEENSWPAFQKHSTLLGTECAEDPQEAMQQQCMTDFLDYSAFTPRNFRLLTIGKLEVYAFANPLDYNSYDMMYDPSKFAANYFAKMGVKNFINLKDSPGSDHGDENRERFVAAGAASYEFIRVEDMKAPTLDSMMRIFERLIEFESLYGITKVGMHCGEGFGRTGGVLVLYQLFQNFFDPQFTQKDCQVFDREVELSESYQKTHGKNRQLLTMSVCDSVHQAMEQIRAGDHNRGHSPEVDAQVEFINYFGKYLDHALSDLDRDNSYENKMDAIEKIKQNWAEYNQEESFFWSNKANKKEAEAGITVLSEFTQPMLDLLSEWVFQDEDEAARIKIDLDGIHLDFSRRGWRNILSKVKEAEAVKLLSGNQQIVDFISKWVYREEDLSATGDFDFDSINLKFSRGDWRIILEKVNQEKHSAEKQSVGCINLGNLTIA